MEILTPADFEDLNPSNNPSRRVFVKGLGFVGVALLMGPLGGCDKLEEAIRKLHQGVDFLGYVSLPFYRVLRTRTKRRMLKRVNRKNIASYLGLLKHGNTFKLCRKLEYSIKP